MNGKNGRTNVHIDFMKGLHKLCGFPRALWFSLSVMVCTCLHSSRWSQSSTGDSWTISDYVCNSASGIFGIFLDSSLKDVALHCPVAKEISRCVASELMACGGP